MGACTRILHTRSICPTIVFWEFSGSGAGMTHLSSMIIFCGFSYCLNLLFWLALFYFHSLSVLSPKFDSCSLNAGNGIEKRDCALSAAFTPTLPQMFEFDSLSLQRSPPLPAVTKMSKNWCRYNRTFSASTVSNYGWTGRACSLLQLEYCLMELLAWSWAWISHSSSTPLEEWFGENEQEN